MIKEIIKDTFDSNLGIWKNFWSRDNLGNYSIKNGVMEITYPSTKDFNISCKTIDVIPGELYEAEIEFISLSKGNFGIGFILYDKNGAVINWNANEKTYSNYDIYKPEKVTLKTKILITSEVAKIVPRIIGYGNVYAQVESYKLNIIRNYTDIPNEKNIKINNKYSSVTLNTSNASFTLTHNMIVWNQMVPKNNFYVVNIEKNSQELNYSILDLQTDQVYDIELSFKNYESPEINLIIRVGNKLYEDSFNNLKYPYTFSTGKNISLIIPANEGLCVPSTNLSALNASEIKFPMFAGHFISMSFYGLQYDLDDKYGIMTIVETPDDANLVARANGSSGTLTLDTEWIDSKGTFGYDRKLTIILVSSGGFVQMAKIYRNYMKEKGMFKKLSTKRKYNENVDKLIGAANIWSWVTKTPAETLALELKEKGMKKVLWSNGNNAEVIKKINDIGYLTGRYTNFENIADPNLAPISYHVNEMSRSSWETEKVIKKDGNWLESWPIKGTDDKMYSFGSLCDTYAVKYAKKRLNIDTSNFYTAVMVDTTTAMHWEECYDERHPLTKSDSKRFRNELLKLFSDRKLITGSETGHESAVPHCHYFEGMMSISTFRIPNAGSNIGKILTTTPDVITKYQLNHKYRIPLWELVYHDCIISYWYWGDCSNKMPDIINKRDLFNILYGTLPLYTLNNDNVDTHKDLIVNSYKKVCPVVEKVSYEEMVSFMWLDEAKNIQTSLFSNGVRIAVNFGTSSYTLGNYILGPGEFYVEQLI